VYEDNYFYNTFQCTNQSFISHLASFASPRFSTFTRITNNSRTGYI